MEFKKRDEIMANSKAELQMYMFHYERYRNHQKSRDLVTKQMVKIQQNVNLLHQVKQYPSSELQFFEACANEVIKCRQILSWTYVVGYYEEKNMTKAEGNLFKFQQTALEEACEMTHKLLESDLSQFLDSTIIDRSPFYKFKAEVTNKM